MINKKIAIIGGGNLGSSLARGLILKNIISLENLIVTNINLSLIEDLKTQLNIPVTTDNVEAIKEADYIFLAVKPDHVFDLLKEINNSVKPESQLLISLASGTSIAAIECYAPEIPIIRAMPNTAMSVFQSMTAISSSAKSEKYIPEIAEIFDQLGASFVVPETDLPAATILASCGIAFALRYMRANTQAGIELGLTSELSNKIMAQVLKGAAEINNVNGTHPEHEIDKVTTPGGITIKALNEMEHNGFSSSIIKGAIKGYDEIMKME